MISLNFEYILGNLSFVCLFVMVIWYWVKIIFAFSPSFQFVGMLGMTVANLSLAGLLGLKWHTSGHFPLSNLFESLLFLSWGFTAFHLVLEKITKSDFIGVITSPMAFLTTAFASFTLPHEMQKTTALIPALQSNWLMMHVTIMMLSYVALISGSLLSIAFLVINHFDAEKSTTISPSQGGRRTPQANEGAIASKRLFQSAKVVSVNVEAMQATCSQQVGDVMIRYRNSLPNYEVACQDKVEVFSQTPAVLKSRSSDLMSSTMSVGPEQEVLLSSPLSVLPALSKVSERQLAKKSNYDKFLTPSPFAQAIDNLSYRTLGLGFPLLTIGILSGAVWANEAWGSYWSWDPKETWAFITWLVFAIYLHTRLGKGWKGTKPATIAAIGFFVVWICYLGVNLLGTGLHSYGWLRASR